MSKEEYTQHLSSLADISSATKFDKDDYVLLSTIGEDHNSIILTITDGLQNLWVKDLSFEDFEEIRKSIGL